MTLSFSRPKFYSGLELVLHIFVERQLMKVDEFFNYREETTDNGIFLTFSGVLTHGFLVKLGDMLKTKLAMFNVDKNLELKIFSTVIEQAQNIIFYSAERMPVPALDNEMMGVGTITVGMENAHFFVFCGNMIPTEKVEKLRNKLLLLQVMSKDELRRYYKEQRRMATDEDSRGAGLGFIEMARKASKAIEFTFRKMDDEHSFFTLKTTI